MCFHISGAYTQFYTSGLRSGEVNSIQPHLNKSLMPRNATPEVKNCVIYTLINENHQFYNYQWQNVTKCIYSDTALKYNFEVFVLNLNISILCYFILQLYYISETNVLFTLLHLFDSFSYLLLCRFRLLIQIINQ